MTNYLKHFCVTAAFQTKNIQQKCFVKSSFLRFHNNDLMTPFLRTIITVISINHKRISATYRRYLELCNFLLLSKRNLWHKRPPFDHQEMTMHLSKARMIIKLCSHVSELFFYFFSYELWASSNNSNFTINFK